MNDHKPPATVTRRKILQMGAGAFFAITAGDLGGTALASIGVDMANSKSRALRSINIMNFLRGEEPREPMDLMLPLTEQMAHIKQHGFAATWLLQYDALVSGPFVDFLKKEMPASHEVGFWFEMNHKLCDAAGVAWRGRADWGWDYHVPVAYLIGYTPEERIKLADAAMTNFKRVWGYYPRSIASWNLDAITIGHLSDHYEIDAFAVCRDQDSTDGFTIWGAPIAGYYPSRTNAWSPALDIRNQIHTPVLRLLGQDPVYYYDLRYPVNDGTFSSAPDTMEPVWPSGQSESFVKGFFEMTAHAPCLDFAYAQLGQENSFGWPSMSQGFAMQMAELAKWRDRKDFSIETMSETGRQFKKRFKTTPAQAQVQLADPFDHSDPAEKSIWYQSRFYRANLHCKGKDVFLRDIAVYSDQLRQPYLDRPTRTHGIEQRLPAVLDGLHWSKDHVPAAGHFLILDEQGGRQLMQATSFAEVRQNGSTLDVDVPMDGGERLRFVFGEQSLSIQASSVTEGKRLALDFQWAHDRTALVAVTDDRLAYRFEGFDYAVSVTQGHAKQTATGVRIEGSAHGIKLDLRQS